MTIRSILNRIAIGAIGVLLVLSSARAEGPYLSHAPLHVPPGPGDRPLADGPAYFVDAGKGSDQNDGSEKSPFKTIAMGMSRLQPGDTLYLRGGIYFEPMYVALRGTAEKPITIRAYRGETAIIDGGLSEFSQHPAEVWEPVPPADGGVDGEYRSVHSFPNRRDIIGAFGDSMVGLQTYWHLTDLQATNENFTTASMIDPNKDTKATDPDTAPIYCGPGVFYDPQNGRIHVRLAHTHLPGVDNYVGETDPRKLPLILAPFHSEPLHVDQGEHLKFQDLTIRGAGYNAVILDRCTDVDFDNVTIHAGTYGMLVRNTIKLRFWRSGVYGNLAGPWAFRSENGLRTRPGRVTRDIARLTGHALWAIETGNEFSVYSFPMNDDWEIAYSVFCDSHDGPYLGGINLRFHNNIMDNMQDDGVYLSPMYWRPGLAPAKIEMYENLMSRCLSTLAFGGPEDSSDIVYFYRNIMDLRGSVKYIRPQVGQDPPPTPWHGRPLGKHSRVAWSNLMVYQNTFVMEDQPSDALMGWLAECKPDHPRIIFNNIFLHLQKLPGYKGPDSEQGVVEDGNLFWSAVNGKEAADKFFSAYRNSEAFGKSKATYPAGSSTHSVVADPKFVRVDVDFTKTNDYTLQEGSAAIHAGVALPTDWPDPLRQKDAGAPDIGALPMGAPMFPVGRAEAPTAP